MISEKCYEWNRSSQNDDRASHPRDSSKVRNLVKLIPSNEGINYECHQSAHRISQSEMFSG